MITDEQVVERARDWASYHKNAKTRDKMDDVLEGLSTADQRRVYLCGQRIAAGMTAKVIPASPASTPKPTAPKPRKSTGKASVHDVTKGKAKATHKATSKGRKGK